MNETSVIMRPERNREPCFGCGCTPEKALYYGVANGSPPVHKRLSICASSDDPNRGDPACLAKANAKLSPRPWRFRLKRMRRRLWRRCRV